MDDIINKVRMQVKMNKILLALSGGVDSSVVAALLNKAIGNQLICIFVDTGLLRLNESNDIMATLANNINVQIIRIDAAQRFIDALENVIEPEIKRKIIGKLFIEIFNEQAAYLQQDAPIRFLAQGTIYPDVIESHKSHLIKSHHNVGGLPETINFELVEPIHELFKDEVRQLGLLLGLSHKMVYRHPFPGPGLAIRIIGEVKPEFVIMLRQADNIFMQTLRQYNYYDKVSQAFAVFLPIKSVGIMGDARTYDYVIALRAVETIDFMTANWAHLPYDLLEEVSLRITNEVQGITRVVYDITGKPPSTIEWE